MITLAYLVSSRAYAFGGFAAGCLAGRATREIHDIREAVSMDDDDDNTEAGRRRRRRLRFDPFAVLVIAVMCAGLVITGYAARQSAQATDKVDETTACTRGVLDQTVKALNERTQFSDASAAARTAVVVAQRQLVDVLLDRHATEADMVAAAREYRRTVGRQIALDRRNADKSDAFPYPSTEQIRGSG